MAGYLRSMAELPAARNPRGRHTRGPRRFPNVPTLPSRSPVTEHPAAEPADALQHFSRLLRLETDCSDVHASLETGRFVLLDVRSPELFRRGHVGGAVNLPHARITERALEPWPPGTLFVVYC